MHGVPKPHNRYISNSSAWSEIGADHWALRIVQWGTLPVCDNSHTGKPKKETTYPKGFTKCSSLNKGAIEPVPFSPGFYSCLFLVTKSNRAVEANNRPFHQQCLCALPELHYGNASVNPWNLQKGQWLTSQNLKILTLYGRHTDIVHNFDTSGLHML